jgi:AhpD family alkylhydroperoxidase
MSREIRIPIPEHDGKRVAPGRAYAPGLTAALNAYQASVVRLNAVDEVTTELVRLRCARVHDCRICQSLRVGAAREAGVDDAMTAKIDFYEESDLPERHKVALRLTDAFVTQPGTITEELRAQLLEHFSPEQIVELMLDITKWSTQKLSVALGLDAAAHPEGQLLDWDEQGNAVWGPALTPA